MKRAAITGAGERQRWPAVAVLCLLAATVCLLAVRSYAGGPLKVAGVSGFDTGAAGTPLTWPQGEVRYYTDQGDLSPVLPQAEANAFVADGFLRWTSVATAALSATPAGQLDEDVNGSNVVLLDYGQVNMPADIQPTALDKPVAIVYDADGKVTDALLGQGAGAADMCGSNAAYGGPDNYSTNAHLAHALVVLNGNCAQTTAALADLKYHLIRVLGRVLGLDWVDLNSNVFTRKPFPIPDDYLGFPVMHALDPFCPNSTVCFTAADELKMDDRAAISSLYPVTSANMGNFSGKQIFRDNTGRVYGTVYFRGRNALPAQPVQGVKVVARWIDPASGQPSHRYTAASVSGFLFRGNAGNPVTGFTDASGERYDKFGSDDPGLEGRFELAGLEFPDGGKTAQYQVSLEAVDPLCAEPTSVGPYRSGQVALSGTAAPITVTLSKGDDLARDFIMSGSALPAAESAGTFAAPARLPAGGNWAGSLSPYGNVDYYSLPARADRTVNVKITALNESGKATQSKAQPVIGLWPASAPADFLPEVAVSYFNALDTGATVLNARFLLSGDFKLGIADFRGDGRPDFRYRARIFYGDTVAPARVAVQSNATLTVRGIGLDVATTAKINGKNTPVVAAYSDRIVLTAPHLPDGVYNLDLMASDGSTSSMINALTYGAAAGDQIVLLQGAANPATPAGGEATNPIRVRVVEADGATPVPGATVSLSASPAQVIFSACGATSCALLTDEQGEAVSRMAPSAAGTFTVTASISASEYVRTSLTGVAAALQIAAVSPSAWVAQSGSGSLPLTVRVLSNSQPVAGRSVRYRVTQGSASLSAATADTNAAGYTSVNLLLSALAGEVHASACVLPDAAPCSNFYIFMVPASAIRLQPVAGEQQIINTAQSFSAVRLRVTDSSTPPNPVQLARVTVLSAVLRWQAPPVASGPNPPPPPAPVVLSSSQSVAYSDASGLVSILPSAAAGFGAVVVKMIAFGDSGWPLQFQVQRLWAPPGWVGTGDAQTATAISERRPRRLPSSPRYPPTD
ncbi:MAG: Ig-like domain-containing protein [Chlamydiota bacterium]